MSSARPHVLALDQGGQSSRALLFDANGAIVARAARSVGETRSAGERVEQDPEELVRSLRDVAGEAIAGLDRKLEIVAGLATQRSSLVCWDRTSGAALSPVLSWQDRRAAAWLARFEPQAHTIEVRTGLRLSPHYGVSKIAWCREQLPDVRRAERQGTLCIGPLASFLAHRLLIDHPLVVDPANASRTLLFQLDGVDWDDEMLALFGIPRAILPRCVPSRSEFGEFELDSRRVPLCILTGDQSAALFAGGEPALDTALVNLGTGGFVQRFVATPLRVAGLLTSLVFVEPRRRVFALEGTINGAGSALGSIGEELGFADPTAELERALSSSEPPPLFLNGVSGLAAPFWRSEFESRFVGSGSAHAKFAAVAESIVFLVGEILERMRAPLGAPRRIELSGGLAQSDALAQRLADACGIEIERSAEPEATARGLAHLCGAELARTPAVRFAPRPDPRLKARMLAWGRELRAALGPS